MRRPQGPARRRAGPIRREIAGRVWLAWSDPWRGVSPPKLMPPCHWCGCGACVDAEMEVRAMKRPSVSDQAASPSLTRVETPKSLAKMPQVAELLCQPAWEDGVAKGERCVFGFVGEGSVRLLVKVENPPVKVLVSGRSWDEAWAALELLLRGEDVPWQADTLPKGGPPRKRR